jgi:hypothetical protein
VAGGASGRGAHDVNFEELELKNKLEEDDDEEEMEPKYLKGNLVKSIFDEDFLKKPAADSVAA